MLASKKHLPEKNNIPQKKHYPKQMLGILTLHLHIPGCKSLKEKRHRLKPLLTRLHREFNVSVAEMDLHDIWQSTVIACALISNDSAQTQRTLQTLSAWVEKNWHDMTIVDEDIEIIS